MELTPKDYKQINFSDLPEIDGLKDVSGIDKDIAIIVPKELDRQCFKSRKLIYSRAEQLNAELVRGWFSNQKNAVKGNYFIFSSRGEFSDTIRSKTIEF